MGHDFTDAQQQYIIRMWTTSTEKKEGILQGKNTLTEKLKEWGYKESLIIISF